MYTLFFEDKTIDFIGDAEIHDGCDCIIDLPGRETVGIAKVLEKLENNKHLCVKAADPEAAFRAFLSQFRSVDAAGGFVENPSGEILMILRNGHWDLPKGHREPGESLGECAEREVREECGITDLRPGKLLAVTVHFYKLKGQWVLKTTSWFEMKSSQQNFVPQEEEGITEIKWIPRNALEVTLSQSYSSIRSVFKKAGMI